MTHKIRLAPVADSPQTNGSHPSPVHLGDLGNGILSLQVSGPDGRNALSRDLLDPLLQALGKAREARSAKVLILQGTPAAFLSGGRRECNLAVTEKLFQALGSFPFPVIASLQGDAAGAGFLAAALCDFMVCSQTARYSFTDPEAGLFPSAEEDRLFRLRFGDARAADFLYWSRTATGRQLREKGWSCPVLPGEEIDAHVQALASSLCRKPGESLRILKQHLALPFAGLAGDLAVAEPVVAEPPLAETRGGAPSESPAVASDTPAQGLEVDASRPEVLVVRLRPSQAEGGWRALLGRISDLLERIGRSRSHKAIVMAGDHEGFFPVSDGEPDGATDGKTADPAGMEFLRLILAAPVPVVAALESDARGFAWLAAQFFDACVYHEQGTYSLGRLPDVPERARQAAAAFAFRFGVNSAREILFTGREYPGLELQRRFQAAAASEQVLPQAIRLAGTWAGLPFGAVEAWKAAASRLLLEKIGRQPPVPPERETFTVPETQAVPEINEVHETLLVQETQMLLAKDDPAPDAHGVTVLPLRSRVVSAALHPEGILVVRMEDREARNMFSEALMDGLQEAFAQAEPTAAKVVILTGFDRYFASGGTKETLLAIQQGKIRFTDNKTFQIGMDCRVPVIAAMQGHGIGAGWALGMFADFTLHCEDGRYLSPYMNYGFTPGAGATFIFPDRAGHDLARETLLTAREYAGDELRSRAIALPVLPRDQVLAAAFELAGRMACLPRSTLAALKHQFNHALREPLEETYALELAMHEKTFVGKTETLRQIHGNFLPENGQAPAPAAPQSAAPPRMPHPTAGSGSPASLAASLKKLLAHELQMREEEIDENTQFVDLGLDSITGVTWVRKINEKFGTSIEATKIYSYPTLTKLLQYVQEEAGKAGASVPALEAPAPQASAPAVHVVHVVQAKQAGHVSPGTRDKLPANGIARGAGRLASWRNQPAPGIAPAASGSPSPAPSAQYPAQYRPQPIAIIGMAGQFPQARNLEEFWDNLAQGRDCITEVPRQRWDADAYYSPGGPAAGKTNCKWMGALEDYDRFDPLFFNISPVEAESMDPQQRLFLQSCWQSIESAGYNPKTLSGSRCGVFAGCSGSEYLQSSREHQLTAQGFTGGATSILAARISFFLNLQGPCLSIDTACSSSLVAIAGACDSLCAGGSDAALAGGVFVMAGPALHVMASQAGMLSPDGRCRSFDQRANGFVPGEGVGVVMLKRLSDAERDRDDILGVIQGWGVNQDGKTNGITAPNPESQARLEMEVYDRHGIDPAEIQVVEAHGTGTKLGDPIEVEALRKAFRKYTRKSGYCALGSVKSNIGHCLTAAGMAGVIKVLLALKHRQIPPTIHFDRLNEHVALEGSPFFVNDRLQDWMPPEGKRQAAVSSFGFSGTNAHLVITEYQPPRHAEEPVTVLAEDGRYAVPLSARTAEQLGEVARGLLEAINAMGATKREERTLDLAELAYTLQVGREALGERLGFMVDSVGQLAEKLEAYLKGDTEGSGAFRGQVLENKEGMRLLAANDIQSAIVESFLAQRKITQLLDLWVKGLALDWNRLYGKVKPRRLRLPAYPFARDRYWLEGGKAPGIAAAIHPLLHRNTSNLAGQSYRSRFTGSESFAAAGAEGRKFLAPMAWLEMARAAVENAVPAEAATPVLELLNLAWEAPMAVGRGLETAVSLSLGEQGRIAFEISSLESGPDSDPESGLESKPRETLHFHGEAVFLDASASSTLDIPRLMESGPAAVLDLPATADPSDYVLPPALLESLLQGCLARVAGPDVPDVPDGSRNPLHRIAALASLTVFSARPPRSLAWVRHSPQAAPENLPVLDVDLCDPEGKVWACLRGFVLAEAGAAAGSPEAAAGYPGAEAGEPRSAWSAWDRASFACQWEQQPQPEGKHAGGHASVLIACWGPSFQLDAALLEQYGREGKAAIRILWFADRTEKVSDRDWCCDTREPGALARCLEGMETPDALYFLALDESPIDYRPAEELLDGRESAEIHMLRLIKHLKRSGSGGIDTYLLTLDAHAEALKGGAPRFRGAGTAGLGYSLAQGSHRFKVRNLDLSAGDLETPEDRKELLAAILREPPSDRGEIIRLREGRRYRRAFFRLKWETPARQGIRQQGVYLIVGGSGTVGRIITRNLISKYQARVVWTGRSGEDSDKVRKALRQIGERVSYVQADATSLADMRRAVEAAKREHGRIDGALFAGMVFDFGNSIDQTTEEEFRSILEVKTRGSLAVYAALEKEPLDFLCYFSSGQAYAFSGAAQLSAYAAGITGADSLANALRRVAAFPVGTLNWGFWKASVEEIKALPDGVATENLDALEDAEGFECFERFVNELRLGRLHQVLCMKASPQIEALMDCNREEFVTLPDGSPRGKLPEGRIEVPSQKLTELKLAGKQAALEEWFIGLLYGKVTGLLGAEALAAPRTAEGLQGLGRVLGKYAGWWKECLGLLAGRGWVRLQDDRYSDWKTMDTGMVRDGWRIQKEVFRKDPDCTALADLVDDCLENLPDILQGRRLATDVIFPDSSMAKVEGVYKHNTLCDTFNGIVANAVAACAQRIAGSAQAGEGLRILEIGAGTGGTSAIVFPSLRPFQASVAKYTYTDLSKAFLFHAEKVFAPECPYLECRLLDIEQPIGPQGFELGGYDVVLATNVLHATRNIRRTLRNAKAALRQGGMLVLNEMSRKSISTHLTFGLLDGWWLSEDPHLRLSGCPGLAPENWQRVLEEEGFHSVTFPALEGHELGNQIIVAHSDGIIRQAAAAPVAPSAASAAPAPASPAPAAPANSAAAAVPDVRSMPAHDLPGFVRDTILACLSGVLKIPPNLIRPDAAFSDYGVDSILGVSFIKQLNERFSISLNTAIIFDHSSLDGLSRHVTSAYRDQVEAKLRARAPSPGAALRPAPALPAAPKPMPFRDGRGGRGGRPAAVGSLARPGQAAAGIPEIAVIGMSGMFPKAGDIRAFWSNLLQGVSGIEELPERYLDGALYSPEKRPGKTRCKWGGILGDRDCFDPLFFNISPKEAESMNPHQRLVMQESWKALEDAGYDPRTLAGSQAGIFIGAEPTGYVGETFTGFSDAIVASRLSYVLNLNGPAFVVNTGCSSSAVALHLACESLRHGETGLALAGGVNACMNGHTQVRLDEIEMLSPSGRCLPFDGRADGTVISEGVGMVVLKRLDEAMAAGDPIYGVICGSGINQDGASNGITAPNGAAQEQLISGVYRKFNLDPAQITYVEAHGTGTKLGDPVEANALVRAFRSFTPKQGYCVLGTAKAHIGHTAAAAGVVGLIKVLLSMRHKRIPHLPGFAALNPLIELQGSPFRINAGVEEWKTQGAAPRMAAINSFGHSGTNAHLVVREFLAPQAVAHPPAGNGGQAIVPLSAKTREQLREKARDLLEYLRPPQGRGPESASAPASPDPDLDLMDVAFTLQTGREAMEERLGILAGTSEQLAGKLRAWLDGEPGLEGVFQGAVKRKHDGMGDFSRDEELQEAVGKWIARGKLAKLLEMWVKGMDLDWRRLYPDAKPRRVRLPAYPFAKERYWASSAQVTDVRAIPPGAAPAKADFGAIEDILKNVDEDSIDTGHALRLLKTLV